MKELINRGKKLDKRLKSSSNVHLVRNSLQGFIAYLLIEVLNYRYMIVLCRYLLCSYDSSPSQKHYGSDSEKTLAVAVDIMPERVMLAYD